MAPPSGRNWQNLGALKDTPPPMAISRQSPARNSTLRTCGCHWTRTEAKKSACPSSWTGPPSAESFIGVGRLNFIWSSRFRQFSPRSRPTSPHANIQSRNQSKSSDLNEQNITKIQPSENESDEIVDPENTETTKAGSKSASEAEEDGKKENRLKRRIKKISS